MLSASISSRGRRLLRAPGSGRRRGAAAAARLRGVEVDRQAAPARAARRPDHEARRRRAGAGRRAAHPREPRGRDRRQRHLGRGVRLQLRRRTLRTLAAGARPCWRRRAGARRRADRGRASRLTLFREPSTDNKGITVIHPQVDARTPLGRRAGDLRPARRSTSSAARRPPCSARTRRRRHHRRHQFSDIRQQVHGGFSYNRPTPGIGASYSYGWESDYRSHSLSVDTHDDLYDHNFTLAVSYTHNLDSVCDANNGMAATSAAAPAAHLVGPLLHSSSHADVVTQPLTHRHLRAVADLDGDARAWWSRGAARSRSSTASSRTPTAACWSAASTAAAGARAAITASATPCSRRAAYAFPQCAPRASGWSASTRTAGRCRP